MVAEMDCKSMRAFPARRASTKLGSGAGEARKSKILWGRVGTARHFGFGNYYRESSESWYGISTRQLVKQRPRLLQIARVEPLSEPAVNRRQKFVCFSPSALLAQ